MPALILMHQITCAVLQCTVSGAGLDIPLGSLGCMLEDIGHLKHKKQAGWSTWHPYSSATGRGCLWSHPQVSTTVPTTFTLSVFLWLVGERALTSELTKLLLTSAP